MSLVAVIGLGYVGLPLAIEVYRHGHTVVGLDTNPRVIDSLCSGVSHLESISDEEVAAFLESEGNRVTSSPAEISECEVYIVTVPTPLNASGDPDMSFVWQALDFVAPHLIGEKLLVIESTSMPGTTSKVREVLETKWKLVIDKDFHLAFSPERVDPGNQIFNLRNTPKIVSADTDLSLAKAVGFYEGFIDVIIPFRGSLITEMAKLFENTFRLVNISLVNELLLKCASLGLDARKVLLLAKSKPYGFMPFEPGTGAGGHCIPIDPVYLSRFLGGFSLVDRALEINSQVLDFFEKQIHSLAQAGNPNGAVVMLGVTYKPNSRDLRESQPLKLAKKLKIAGLDIVIFDPELPRSSSLSREFELISDLEEFEEEPRAIVIGQAHASIMTDKVIGQLRRWLANGVALVDTTGRLTLEEEFE
jgi:UDP-N-acetyl-D-glucosamine dehydrogenase